MSETIKVNDTDEMEVKDTEIKLEDKPVCPYPYMIPVRFESSNRSYSFGAYDDACHKGDWVVVETQKGLELAQATDDAKKTDFFHSHVPMKPIKRIATSRDRTMYEENKQYSREAFHVCENEIKNLGLNMHLMSAEYMLDRQHILFLYKADQRVDFRELLHRLNARLQCRIELRQIGDRDKARMVGGIGMCGMECCCSRFKTHMDVISINMAKTQLLALNTEKLSGMCGKLMCCLKYENDTYKELTEGLPKIGAHVEYDGVMYRVSSMNVMNDSARLENSETFQEVTLEDLREKAIVRKGVTVARKGPGRSRPATTIPGVHKNNMSSGPISTNFSTSDESRKQEKSPERTPDGGARKAAPAKAAAARKQPRKADAPRNNNRAEGNRGGNRRSSNNNNNRRINRPQGANVEVRSFKSRHKEETSE